MLLDLDNSAGRLIFLVFKSRQQEKNKKHEKEKKKRKVEKKKKFKKKNCEIEINARRHELDERVSAET